MFTQEDPIGLAGGLNLYGFAGGDPINFYDPFGLAADSVRGSDEAKRLVQRAVNVYRNASNLNRVEAKNINALLQEYDEVSESATDHLNVEIGECAHNRDAPGCYDPESQTLTVNPEAIERQQSIVPRRPITTAAHEMGHFLDYRRYFGKQGDDFANFMENILRTALGMGKKGEPIRP